MIAEKIPELKSLSAEEKLILVGELWNELAAQPDAFPPRAYSRVAMSLPVEFLFGADAELQQIFNRFEDYRDGFGVEFMTVVDAYLTRIGAFPEIAPI